MKIKNLISFFTSVIIATVWAQDVPLIHMNSGEIKEWATGYQNVSYGSGVDDLWKTPQKALGKATGETYDIVCLGNGGQITMTFSPSIKNGSSFDFAVFENSNDGQFLELAWVEVSSDGTHFVRFPNQSLTPSPVGSYGTINSNNISGLAGKFKQGYGTEFDLAELQALYSYLIGGGNPVGLTSTFQTQLTGNFPYLDLNNVRYVRIIDIVGDGNARDAFGHVIYDPYPTFGSGGFDLEAIAVMNQVTDTRLAQTITFPSILNQKLSSGSLPLNSTASSGLPVSFSLVEGSCSISSNTLTFGSAGRITVQALQSGDGTYAPAVPATQSFYVADKIQHIYIEPAPNQITGTIWQVRASASSGLPVSVEVFSGPATALINQTNHLLTVGSQTGTVELRVWQSGNTEYAPADDARVSFSIVTVNNTNAPKTFAQWSAARSLATDAQLDSDGDGAKNIQEFVMGTDPKNSNDVPRLVLQTSSNAYGEQAMLLKFPVNRQSYGRALVQKTTSISGVWSNVIPEIVSTQSATNSGQAIVNLTVQVPIESNQSFYRLLLQDQ